jgi:hypothetical protein
MHIASIPRNKHLLVADSGGNISTVDLNSLIDELEGKMVQIKNGAKGETGPQGPRGEPGQRGPTGLQGDNANCITHNSYVRIMDNNAGCRSLIRPENTPSGWSGIIASHGAGGGHCGSNANKANARWLIQKI